jgi:hypothetical protein
VTFQLDRSNLTSADGQPLVMPDAVAITTAPFTVDVQTPAAPDGGAAATVNTGYQVPLAVSTRPAPLAQLGPFVHARAAGADADLAVSLAADARDPRLLYLMPAACLGGWPVAATITVTVDAAFPDAFGVPLGAPVTATFTTSAAASGTIAPDASCPSPDGGAAD